MEPVWAVVVARVGRGAKSRLSNVLDPGQRRALALAMLADVIDVCGHSGLAGTVAVVDEAAAHDTAERAGAIVVADPGGGDMNAAASVGLLAARKRGAATAVIIPGDVPLIAASDLAALLESAGAAPRAVIVAASVDGEGTNALLLRPPDVIAPQFGPPSVGRHVRLGVAAGALTRIRAGLGLSLDIDTPADLTALAGARGGSHTAGALRTLLENQALARP